MTQAAVWLACAGLALACATGVAQARDIEFSGYTWTVRTGSGGPGPNLWDERNVWVGHDGLHLRIVYADGAWRCAEVTSKQALGFGHYQVELGGRPDLFDRNIILGFFNYAGPDGTNEIDIEFSQWGKADNANRLNWTVYPARGGARAAHIGLPLLLESNASTHQWTWTPKAVEYASFQGWQSINTAQAPIGRWHYAPGNLTGVPQTPMPVKLNLWLDHGDAPTDHQPVEVVLRSFSFEPLQ